MVAITCDFVIRRVLHNDPVRLRFLPYVHCDISGDRCAGSAKFGFDVKGTPVNIVTVLPGAGAALVREESEGGERFVALQATSHSQNPGRDLACALNWVVDAAPGETLQSTVADGSQPELATLLDGSATPVTTYQDFSWWFPEGAQVPPQI